MDLELWELASYVVTVIGLPFGIAVLWYEQRKERENEEEEGYQLLSDAYTDFLNLALDNADLQLRSGARAGQRTSEEQERVQTLFEILISLFERAYLLAYEEGGVRVRSTPRGRNGPRRAGRRRTPRPTG
jgi:hypothetical protein